jgi:hypothetical protein
MDAASTTKLSVQDLSIRREISEVMGEVGSKSTQGDCS